MYIGPGNGRGFTLPELADQLNHLAVKKLAERPHQASKQN